MVAADTQNCSKHRATEIGRYNFERVDSFTYLGSLVAIIMSQKKEITNRLIVANRAHFGLKNQLESQLLSKNTKIFIYKTLVKPVFTYVTETWTTTKNDERRLSIFKRKILPRIFDPKYKRGQWPKRYNGKLEELYNEPDTVNVIKSSRLRWAGHVAWMDKNELPKKILWTNPGGQCRRGRPKSRWTDREEEDARKLGCRNWLAAAQDRGRWRHLLEEAKAHPGL